MRPTSRGWSGSALQWPIARIVSPVQRIVYARWAPKSRPISLVTAAASSASSAPAATSVAMRRSAACSAATRSSSAASASTTPLSLRRRATVSQDASLRVGPRRARARLGPWTPGRLADDELGRQDRAGMPARRAVVLDLLHQPPRGEAALFLLRLRD